MKTSHQVLFHNMEGKKTPEYFERKRQTIHSRVDYNSNNLSRKSVTIPSVTVYSELNQSKFRSSDYLRVCGR